MDLNNIETQRAGRYFLPIEYTSRTQASTLEETVGTYWTAERLRTSESYQYDVYRMAYEYINCENRLSMLLDVGCGPARKHKFFSTHSRTPHITLVDQATVRGLALEALPNGEFHEADLEDPKVILPVDFDVVICADVIEHLLNPTPCIDFLKTCVKPDGLIIISTPDRDRLYGKRRLTPGHPCHVREWNTAELSSYLKSCGLEVVRQEIVHQKRTSLLRRTTDPILDRLGFRVQSFSCQVAVCRSGRD